ncbi:hypothetical protein K438DRAFT_1858086, partial [Mycena galopus ATCC 62051]
MVRGKGYGPEHNKWVKHSDVFTKDTINTYYRRYPNAPRRIASAAFDSLSFRRHNAHVRFMRRDAAFQGGGDVRGTTHLSVCSSVRPAPAHRTAPLLHPILRPVQPRPSVLPRPTIRPSVLRPSLRLRPSGLRPPPTPLVWSLSLAHAMRSSSRPLPIDPDTCYWL